MGGQASVRGGSEGGPPRRRARAQAGGIQGARPRLRPQVSQSGAGHDPPHAPGADPGRLLQRVELHLVSQRPRGALHHPRGQALLLAGAHAGGGRPHQRLGPPELPLLRPGLQVRLRRRLRGGLAARLRRPGTVLRPRRGVRRHHGGGRGDRRTAGRPLPAAHGHALRRAARVRPGQEEARLDHHQRPRRQPDPAHQRPPGLPLLRSLRARMRDEVVLQLRLHHGGRRPRHRPLHARAQRDGLQGPHGPRRAPGPRRALHRSRDARGERGLRADGRARRPGPGVGAHHVELRERAGSRRSRQLVGRARPLPDGPSLGGRGGRAANSPTSRSTRSPTRTLPSGRTAST